MNLVTDASRQLANRPPDEHFASFGDLLASAQDDKDNAGLCSVLPTDLRLGDCNGKPTVTAEGLPHLTLTHWSAGQLASMAGAPRELLFERLSYGTAYAVLNELLRQREETPLQLLANTQSGNLRAITGKDYRRVWDADLLSEVERWLLPSGFEPARPTKNTNANRDNIMGNNKPALFRGDRDSFSFFMTPEATEYGPGDRPQRRGVFVYNSEVGARSFGMARFLFDDVCANFLVWGATAMKRIRLVHRGRSGSDILRRFRGELSQVAPTVFRQEMEALQAAAERMFCESDEEGVERLRQQYGVTKAIAEQAAIARTFPENSEAGRVNSALRWAYGLSTVAKKQGNASEVVALATTAGDLVAIG